MGLKNYNKANALYEKAISLDFNHYQAHICYAISLFEQNKIDEAVNEYNTAVKINPDNVNAYLLLGNLYSSIKKYDEAVNIYKKIWRII